MAELHAPTAREALHSAREDLLSADRKVGLAAAQLNRSGDLQSARALIQDATAKVWRVARQLCDASDLTPDTEGESHARI